MTDERADADGSTRQRPTARLALLAAVGLLGVSCAPGGQADADRPPAPTPQVLEVAMRDDSYAFERRPLRPGRVLVRAHNHGETEHDVALVELPDDVAGAQEWLDSGVGGVQPVYTMAERSPGQEGVFAVDLAAGHYGMLCLVEDEDGTPHYRQGMLADFRVGDTDADRDAGADADDRAGQPPGPAEQPPGPDEQPPGPAERPSGPD